MKVFHAHICSNCRTHYPFWLTQTKNKKLHTKPGSPWPLPVPIPEEIVNICSSCGHKMRGRVVVREAEVGSDYLVSFLVSVNEVTND